MKRKYNTVGLQDNANLYCVITYNNTKQTSGIIGT